jgi:hypothetical protein
MAVSMGLCPRRPGGKALITALTGPDGCWLCEAAGGELLRRCQPPRGYNPAAVGPCLAAAVADLPEVDAALRGAGIYFSHPIRNRADDELVAGALGAHAQSFLAGTRDPLAGSSLPYERPPN